MGNWLTQDQVRLLLEKADGDDLRSVRDLANDLCACGLWIAPGRVLCSYAFTSLAIGKDKPAYRSRPVFDECIEGLILLERFIERDFLFIFELCNQTTPIYPRHPRLFASSELR